MKRLTISAFDVRLDLVEQASTLTEAKRILRRAEAEALRLRYQRKDQGNGCLLDYLRGRLGTTQQKVDAKLVRK